jgi:hypothetical protein
METKTMVRKQVYLSAEQEQALKSLATTFNMGQSELIREALDLLLAKRKANYRQWQQALRGMKGLWSKDQEAEQRMDSIRQEFDR